MRTFEPNDFSCGPSSVSSKIAVRAIKNWATGDFHIGRLQSLVACKEYCGLPFELGYGNPQAQALASSKYTRLYSILGWCLLHRMIEVAPLLFVHAAAGRFIVAQFLVGV